MKILVLGAHGLLGQAIARELDARGHRVVRAARQDADLCIDLRFDLEPETLRAAVRSMDVVVNAVGVLIERDGNSWDTVHRRAAQALATACAAERVARIVHISALGVGTGIAGGYMASKQAAEDALAAGPVDYAVVRPSLLVDPLCPSTRLFRWLAGLPIIALPGMIHPGASRIAPVHVADVAACVARICEYPKALRRVIELTGNEVMTYREMLARYRTAQGRRGALWLPVPWWLMKFTARCARVLPQTVLSIDTMRMLQSESLSQANELHRWLGRAPLALLRASVPASSPDLLASMDVADPPPT